MHSVIHLACPYICMHMSVGIYGRVSLHVLACVHTCDTDCALTCESPRLQSLFHVTDVFLPKTMSPTCRSYLTLTGAVAPALSACANAPVIPFLFPLPPVNAPHSNIPCLWLPSEAVCLPTTPHALQWSIQQHSWGTGKRAGRVQSLPRWNRTNPYPAHRMNHLSAGK